MGWQTAFSGVAATAAIAAALFAWFAVVEARRQTRVSAGDVDPEFSIHRTERDEFSDAARFCITCRNLNRKRIFIDALSLDCEDEYVIAGVLEDTRISIEKVLAESRKEKFVYRFNPPFLIEGHDPGLVPSRWSKDFRMLRRDRSAEPFIGTAESVIEYRVDGDADMKQWIGSLTVNSAHSHR